MRCLTYSKCQECNNVTASDYSHITYDMTSLQKAVNENFDVRATQRENETLIFSDDLPTHHDSPEVDVGPIVDASSMKELQDSTQHIWYVINSSYTYFLLLYV
ncbi:uncharacterized protein LOC143039826 [Oratosquilla oratoria]|uniref:uncharacterized protein LOC143039826 n=1 Tax=Oratosquilla oratoria TaxID=337810 RepID=UPI003F775E38